MEAFADTGTGLKSVGSSVFGEVLALQGIRLTELSMPSAVTVTSVPVMLNDLASDLV